MKIHEASIKGPRIEMLPLIDSFFLILVYFIFAFLSMSVHRGLPVSLPKASTAVEQKLEHVGISITKDGMLFLNKQRVTKDELKIHLEEMRPFFASEKKYLYIYGDKDTTHGKVIEVFDMVRKAGIQKIFIETIKNNDDL